LIEGRSLMKRKLLAGMAGLAALISASAALAEHHHHEDRGEDRGGRDRGEYRNDRGDYRQDQGDYRRAPLPYVRPWQRGAYLPPEHWRSAVPTPGRFHLRPAPYGYHWVVVGRDAYLIQSATGLVVESAPGAVY
jgi:Ni/Co efflux regulator RcnB